MVDFFFFLEIKRRWGLMEKGMGWLMCRVRGVKLIPTEKKIKIDDK